MAKIVTGTIKNNVLYVGGKKVKKLYNGTALVFQEEVIPPDPVGNIINVGTGSGTLTITQASTGAVAGDTILIAAGTYDYVTIRNFTAPVGQYIYVKNAGQVNITGELSPDNLDGVVIAGDYVSGMPFGFKFQNITGRACKLYNKFTRSTLKSMLFKNVSDIAIATESSIGSKPYTGSDATRSDSIRFLNLEFENCQSGGISYGGELFYGTGGDAIYTKDQGFTKGLEVANCYFHDMSPGSCIYMGNVEAYNIHHNRMERINALTNNHNGITQANGSGQYHHNFVREHQGDAIRCWIYSRNGVVQKAQVYDNIIADSRKYSAFEFQGFERYNYPGIGSFGKGECYNNTIYNMHYEDISDGRYPGFDNYHGVILDTYNMAGGTTEAWNNVGIHFTFKAGGGTNPLWGNGTPDNTYPNSNRYYETLEEAGVSTDLLNLLTGTPLKTGDFRQDPYNITDYKDIARVGRTTIGAIQ